MFVYFVGNDIPINPVYQKDKKIIKTKHNLFGKTSEVYLLTLTLKVISTCLRVLISNLSLVELIIGIISCRNVEENE